MGLGGEAVAPQRFAVELNIMFVLLLLDALINGVADHVRESLELTLVVNVLPLALHVATISVFVALLGHTFLLRYGLLLVLWKEFRSLAIMFLVRFTILATARMRCLVARLGNSPFGATWDDPAYNALYYTNSFATALYDAWLLHKCYSLARVRYFKPHLWQRHQRRTGRATTPSSGSLA